MRLAASNIAWPASEDEAAAALLREQGAEGVELAPTKVWPRPLEASKGDLDACRRWWEGRGLRVVALQALLFGRPELTLFGPAESRREMIDYLKCMNAIAEGLGARALVFGSPKNRRVGAMHPDEARRIAVDAFGELGDDAARRGIWFCIEPNPPEYGCDYVTRIGEGADLVRCVGSPGFGLHLDAGGMTLAGDRPAEGAAIARHVHASEPMLAPVGSGAVDHAGFAHEVRSAGYDGWVSIEMRQPEPADSWASALANALRVARCHYLDAPDERAA